MPGIFAEMGVPVNETMKRFWQMSKGTEIIPYKAWKSSLMLGWSLKDLEIRSKSCMVARFWSIFMDTDIHSRMVRWGVELRFSNVLDCAHVLASPINCERTLSSECIRWATNAVLSGAKAPSFCIHVLSSWPWCLSRLGCVEKAWPGRKIFGRIFIHWNHEAKTIMVFIESQFMAFVWICQAEKMNSECDIYKILEVDELIHEQMGPELGAEFLEATKRRGQLEHIFPRINDPKFSHHCKISCTYEDTHISVWRPLRYLWCS